MNFFVSNAFAEATAASGANDPLALLLPIGLVVVLYIFMIHPQIKRQKQHKAMVDSLVKGDEIVTNGGLVGRIADLGDNFAVLEIATNVQVKIRRLAVETVLPKGSLKEL
ncbi:preprotein translocase subunit YidC [Achromatium sp. WMS3]|nr:preprotein translocase subunit YidC [Achromatium sp. WMS3]